MINNTLATLLLLALPLPGYTENIIEIDRGDTPGRVYIDFDSIIRDKDLVVFW